MQLNGLLHGARLLAHVDFPTSEVLGPGRERGRDPGPDRPARADLHQAGVPRRRRQEGQGRADRQGADAEGGAGREGAALLLRAPARQRLCQGERRDLRGRGAGRARGLFLDHRRHPLPGADDDADPSRRHGHRGAAEVGRGHRAVRGADRAEGLRGGERAHRHRRAEGDHLAAGAAPAEALGAGAPLRHDDAGAEPDPDAAGPGRPADAGRLRLQVRLRPRRPAGGAARAAGPAVRGRHLGLRAGGEPAAHPPGPVGRVRHQRARARSSRRPSAAARTASSPRCWARRRSSRRTSAATRPTRR